MTAIVWRLVPRGGGGDEQAIQRRRRDTTRVKTLEETRRQLAREHTDGKLISYHK